MARHLDLRHDGDEPRLRVRDQLRDVVLGVKAAMRLAVEAPLGGVAVGVPDERLAPPRADLREAWVLADLDAPPLVVGEVQVQPAELMERGEIDELLHELLRHEVARHVQENPPPAEPREVFDGYCGNGPDGRRHPRLAEDGRWKQLAQRLERVEYTRRLERPDRDAPQGGGQPVPLP